MVSFSDPHPQPPLPLGEGAKLIFLPSGDGPKKARHDRSSHDIARHTTWRRAAGADTALAMALPDIARAARKSRLGLQLAAKARTAPPQRRCSGSSSTKGKMLRLKQQQRGDAPAQAAPKGRCSGSSSTKGKMLRLQTAPVGELVPAQTASAGDVPTRAAPRRGDKKLKPPLPAGEGAGGEGPKE
jgi:hypothetical protein